MIGLMFQMWRVITERVLSLILPFDRVSSSVLPLRGLVKVFCTRERDILLLPVAVEMLLQSSVTSIRERPVNLISVGRKFCFRFNRFRSRVSAKKSQFEDYECYAKPLRLLPAKEVKVRTDTLVEDMFTSLRIDRSCSIFNVDIGTSKIFGSNLTDINSGVLLCLIDENGDSILRRIPCSLLSDHSSKMDSTLNTEIVNFQRGSVHEFIFEGPKLGRVDAIWIGVESGQWRLGSLSVTVVSEAELEKTDDDENRPVIVKYDFPVEDILLGERGNISMVELRPCLVTNLSGADPFSLLIQKPPSQTTTTSVETSNEESMKEYADLKFSLLLYDAVLIIVGTTIALFWSGESTSYAFFFGGISGFVYLLLLQRTVDGLQSPELTSLEGDKNEKPFERARIPTSSLALGIGLVLFAVKYNRGELSSPFTPKEVVAGMLGFLACKVAVVLAALNPVAGGEKLDK